MVDTLAAPVANHWRRHWVRPGALSTDETQVFQTSLKNCIGKNSVDHGDPAAFFQPKRSVSLEGMC